MRKLWMRVGMTLDITEEEEKILFSENGNAGQEIVKKIFAEGRAMLDGETYSPYSAVEDFNEEYGTNYPKEDIGWDLYDKAPIGAIDKTKQNKLIIPLGFANLVAEPGPDSSFREVIIGLEDDKGEYLQDLAVIGNEYSFEDDRMVYSDNVAVRVYADKNSEDFTHKFNVGLYSPENEPQTWICVYKDALNFEDDIDNLTNICVPTDWLLKKLRADGETDFNSWLSEYTADNTDSIARAALAEGVIISCDDKRIPLPKPKKALSEKISEAQAKQSTGPDAPGPQPPKEPTR